jgi:hypothetical protein
MTDLLDRLKAPLHKRDELDTEGLLRDAAAEIAAMRRFILNRNLLEVWEDCREDELRAVDAQLST